MNINTNLVYSDKRANLGEIIYLASLFVSIVAFTLRLTEINDSLPQLASLIQSVGQVAVILSLVGTICLNKFDYRQVIFWLIIFSILLFIRFQNKSNDLILLFIMVVGATNINYEKILKTYIVAQILTILLTVFLAYKNIILNLVYYRSGIARTAWGFGYPTTMGAILFYTFLAIAVLKRFSLSLIEYILGAFLIFLTYLSLNARLDCTLILIILIISLLKNKLFKIVRCLNTWILPIISTVLIFGFITVGKLFNSSNSLMISLNSLFSGRLMWSHVAFERYSPKFCGQIVKMQGNGSLSGQLSNASSYFYIDNSFLQILLIDGILLFIIIIVLIWYLFIKWQQNKKISLVIALFLVVISSLVDDLFLSLLSNFILLSIYANTNDFVE